MSVVKKTSTDEIHWNQVFYIDCMDPRKGMPSLPDKSIELGYTDPVWNSDMKPNIRKYHDRTLDNDKNKVFFDDKIDDFEEWTLNWFQQLERVTLKIVLVILLMISFLTALLFYP